MLFGVVSAVLFLPIRLPIVGLGFFEAPCRSIRWRHTGCSWLVVWLLVSLFCPFGLGGAASAAALLSLICLPADMSLSEGLEILRVFGEVVCESRRFLAGSTTGKRSK